MQRTTCTRDFLLSGVIALAAIVFLLVLRAEDVARHTVAILLLPGLRAADVTGYGFQDAGIFLIIGIDVAVYWILSFLVLRLLRRRQA